MITDTLDHCSGATIAHAESLSGDTAEECLAAGCTIKHYIPDEDILLGCKCAVLWRVDDQPSATKPLAHIIVGITLNLDADTPGKKGAKTLAGRAVELYLYGVFRQTFGAPFFHNLV